jgi:1,4-alpha-glucan branching enzyme
MMTTTPILFFAAHGFTGHYDEYFGLNTDTESFNYLTLANYMLHGFYPDFMITISEVRIQLEIQL